MVAEENTEEQAVGREQVQSLHYEVRLLRSELADLNSRRGVERS